MFDERQPLDELPENIQNNFPEHDENETDYGSSIYRHFENEDDGDERLELNFEQ